LEQLPFCSKSQEDGKLNVTFAVRILCIVVGACLVFFALTQLSYRYPLIPYVVMGFGLILIIVDYSVRLWKYKHGDKSISFALIRKTETQQCAPDNQNENYNRSIGSGETGNPLSRFVHNKKNPDEKQKQSRYSHHKHKTSQGGKP